MNRQDFTEKMSTYFDPMQVKALADYAEKLQGLARYGSLGSMTGFDYICIRFAEEASKGYTWLVQYAADIIGEREVVENMPDFDGLYTDINRWISDVL